MMLGGISIWQLLIVLGIIILIFGTKKLRNMGDDLGGAMKGFKQAMNADIKETDKTWIHRQFNHEEQDADKLYVSQTEYRAEKPSEYK